MNAPDANTPLLINVDTSETGGVFSWDVPNLAGISGIQAPYILWNFGDTTSLTIASGDSIEGSIYAPNAAVSNFSPANVEGQLIAESAELGSLGQTEGNGGELHHFPFEAELSCETDDEPTPSITPTDKPTTDKPTTDKPTTDKPTTEKPTTDKPTTDKPTTDKPTTDTPTTDKPTTDKPTTDGPTSEAPPTDGKPSGGTTTSTDPKGAGPPGGSLATTGGSTRLIVLAALALAAVGTAAVVLSRSRRSV